MSVNIFNKSDQSLTPLASNIYSDVDYTEVKEELDNKADKATTLAGYGIVNSYAKTEVDDLLDDKADKDDLTTLDKKVDNLSAGGSTVKATFDTKHATQTATLVVDSVTYTATVDADGLAKFTSIKEVGTAVITCGVVSAKLSIPYYGVYTVTVAGYNYQTWLDKGGVTTSFASLDEVLADQTTVRRLMTVHDSADYLYEWYTNDSTILDTVMASTYGAKWLGLRDYACDKFMANSTAKATMLASDNWEYILKDHVPTMTSNSAPYGEVYATDTNTGSNIFPYGAFDGDENTYWFPTTTSGGGAYGKTYLRYKFTNPIKVKRVYIMPVGGKQTRIATFKIGYSNDGSNWTYTNTISWVTDKFYYDVDIDDYYLYINFMPLSGSGDTAEIQNAGVSTLQFYGRSLNVSVPTMTSNTAPWGTASADSYYDEYAPYLAYDNSSSTRWCANHIASASTSATDSITYNFDKPICVRGVTLLGDTYAYITKAVISVSDDNTTWSDVYTESHNSADKVISINTSFDNDVSGKYVKITLTEYNGKSSGTLAIPNAISLNFYGTDYSEREFGDSTIKYLYDHGLELESIEAYNNGGTITKKADSIYVVGSDNSSKTTAIIDSANTIVLSSYNLERVCISDFLLGSYDFLRITSQKNSTGTAIAYSKPSGLPYNWFTDISSISSSYYADITVGGDASNYMEITEWWLE